MAIVIDGDRSRSVDGLRELKVPTRIASVPPANKPQAAVDFHRDSFVAAPSTAVNTPKTQAPSFGPLDWLKKLLGLGGTGAPSATGTVDPNGRAADASSGAEAAARLKNDANYLVPGARAADLLETVKEHQNDPAFLAELYKNLDPKLAAQLLGEATHGASGADIDALAKSLSSAAATGSLPAGYLAQLGTAAAGDLENALSLSQVLGSSQGAGLDPARRAFLTAVMDSNHALGTGDAAALWARAAGQVMASDPSGGLVKDYLAALPSDARETFLKNGLSLPPSWGPASESTPFDGMERVIGLTAKLTGDGFADFRAQVFRVASNALPDLSGADPGLVNGLKTLYMSDAKGITERLFDENGQPGFDKDSKALGNFFQAALFTHPDANDPLVKTISSVMAELRSNIFDPNATKGDREYAGKVLGDLLGSLQVGYLRGVQQNGNEQEANKALVDTVVGLFDVSVPGGKLGGLALDQAKKMATDLISGLLNGGLKADQASMTKLRDTLMGAVLIGVRQFDKNNNVLVEEAVRAEMDAVITANTQLTMN